MERRSHKKKQEVKGTPPEEAPDLAEEATESKPSPLPGASKVGRHQSGDTVPSVEIPPKRPKVDRGDSGEAEALPQELPEVAVPGPSPKTILPCPLARSSIKTLTSAPEEKEAKGVEGKRQDSPEQSKRPLYQLKWVVLGGKNCPIVTQNENGPCPLIGIINVLLLKNKIIFDEEMLAVSEQELMLHLHRVLLATMPKDSGDHNPNQLQNVQDAVTQIPNMCTGLNVNVRFSGVKNFEYTPECLIFDILGIPLYHGWLYDPQSTEIAAAIGNQSYNQLVESIIEKKTSKDPDKVAEALIAENFLEATASQLTVYGLCELNASLKKGELAILFRNNHFIVLYKNESNVMCQLVTDQGFLEELDVVWETLSTINGDETFLDGCFTNSIAKENTPSMNPEDEQQISHDEELARQLHVEEQRMAQASASRSGSPTSERGSESKPSSPSSSSRPGTLTRDQDEPPKSKEWKCIVS